MYENIKVPNLSSQHTTEPTTSQCIDVISLSSDTGYLTVYLSISHVLSSAILVSSLSELPLLRVGPKMAMAQNPGPGDRFENGPYNLLSLDGGGIRGVSELVILDKIMRRVQEKEGLDRIPKPCDYFHLMGGTSTGGLIAIMLGRLRMSTTEALAEYNNFARQIFRKKNRQISVSSQFREATLESIVRDVAKKYAPESSELMRDPNRTPRSWLGRAFVCARPSKDQDRGPLRIRAYPSDDDWAKDCKIWEAARATTAAPLYFKSISITSGNVIEQFIDPALGCNNPVAEVLDEAGEILDASCKLGCVLSLGTGTRPKSLEKAGGMGRNLQVFKLLKDYTTDSERTHSEMLRRFTDFPSTYFRFSVPGAAAKIGMAKHKKIGELTRMTEEYLESPEVAAEIEKIVDILCEGTTEGVTVGHVRYPNKNQIVMDKRRANAGGIASTLFTGRTEILERLSVFFSKREGNTGPRREFLLYGMGGVGKTQIALKFKQTMESEKRFGRVLWVDATDSTTIEECYNDIAVNLGVTGGTGKDRVLEWMNTTDEEWLLIMDNRNDDDQPITRYLPTMDKGNMLYTTRPDHIKQMLPGDAVAEVDKMEEQEAVTMLLKATRQPTDSPKFRAIGLPIVQELGCLPLAIDQAGAYIYMDGCYLGDYLALFLKHKQSMLKKPRYKGSSERNLPVYATFDLSHKVLASYSKGKRGLETAEIARIALKVLSFVCFYHDQGIMEETVKRAAEWRAECPVPKASVLGQGRLSLEDVVRIDQGHTWNPETFRDAVRLLESLSVVKRDRARTFSLHVLVHSWARDRMIDEERDSFSMSARSILYESIPFGGDSDDVLYRRRIAPHIRACEALVKHRSSEEKENVYLARRAAVTRDAGRLDDALKLWEEVVRERRFLEGPDSEHAIRFTYEMACTYLDAGDLLQAEAWLTEVLERADGIIPETDRFFSNSHHQMMKLYNDIGFAAEAAKHQGMRIRFVKKEGNTDAMADLPEMEDLYREFQAMAGHAVPEDQLLPAPKPSEAELWAQYEEALNVHGSDGVRTLRALHGLANLTRKERRGTCAWILAETVVSRCRKRYGRFHLLIRRALWELSKAYYMDGFLLKAQEAQRENVDLHLSQCGANSFHTEHQITLLEDLGEWTKKTVERMRQYTRSCPKRDLPKAPEVVLEVYRKSVFSSVCHMSPCGQTRHMELISRLGLEEKYPQGVLITPDDVGFLEMGIKVEDLYAERI